MKKWIGNNQALFKSKRFKAGALIGALILIIGIITGPQFYGYVMTVAAFTAFYLFSKQAEREHILSPTDLKNIQADIEAIQAEMDFIQQHVDENPSDLDAKLMLRDLESELESVRGLLPPSSEKK